MININQTSENSKIYIQRNITNDEPVINNYVTEDELQEQLKNISMPYLVVDHKRFENGDWGYAIVSGDYNGVLQAIKENKPQIIYIPYENPGTYLLPHSFQYNSIQDGIYVSTNVHNAVDMNFHYYVYLIKENSVEQTVRETRYVQEKLVSGENIKTINGNDILGDGDIIIESGNGNLVELTQEEYNNINPEPDTLYVISDAPAVEIPDTSEFITESELNSKGYTTSNSFKTINNQSIVGSGNITIEGGSGSEPLYLWKALGNATDGPHMRENLQVRELLLSLKSSEEYPIVILKDYYNDTICNNIYVSTDYVEIQCCNSRIGGTPNDLTDERYELLPTGMLRYVKNDVVATQNYVDEQIGNINNVLENIIG